MQIGCQVRGSVYHAHMVKRLASSSLLAAALAVLPCAVASAAADRPRCGTAPPFDERGRFTGGARARPDSVGYVDSDYYDIRVHYQEHNEDLVDLVLAAANEAWRVEVDEWGWIAPGPDGGAGGSDALDIYIADAGDAAGYTAPEDHYSDGDRYVCPTYVVIDDNLGIDDLTRSTTVHEFNHVVQMWTDCAEDYQLFEASATITEEWIVEGYDWNWWMTAYFQDGCHRSLDYFEWSEPPQYGSFIFLQYLSERFDDGSMEPVVAIWDDARQGDAGNSNTWMDALERWLEAHWNDDVGAPKGDELYTELAWREFSEWRYFLGANADDDHWQIGRYDIEGNGLEMPHISTVNFDDLVTGPVEVDLRLAMAETSSGALPIRYPEEGWTIEVELEAEGDAERWSVTLLFLDASGAVVNRALGDIGAGRSSVSGQVPGGALNGLVIVANVGDGVLDPREDDWDGTGARITVTASGGPAGDDDDGDGGDDGGDGCACSAAGGRASLVPVLLAAALAAGRRRRGA